MVAGVVAGFVIGVVAALLGVAGGELLIPTLVLLFGAGIKLAGSLSLAVSPADDARRLRAVLVRTAALRFSAKIAVSCWSWQWLNRWELRRRSTAWRRSDARTVAPTSADSQLSAFKVWRHK